MTVHFIGAGPGAADLLTLRAKSILETVPICLYAGSIVPQGILSFCRPDARLVNTASLCLDEIEAEYVAAHAAGLDVARLHSGDLSIYSAVAEQISRLRRHDIPYSLTPGVPAFAAAAATLGRELTVPRVAQTIVLTRIDGRASPMPPGEQLSLYARTGATLAIHLAIHRLPEVIEVLLAHYDPACPVVIASHVSQPQEQILRGTLETIGAIFAESPVMRTGLILVGWALDRETPPQESALYDATYVRRYRGMPDL